MEYIIGLTVAAAVALFAILVGLARERSFYATVLIIVRHYYVLFAASSPRRLVTSSCWAAVKMGFPGTRFWRDAERRRREGFLDILGNKKGAGDLACASISTLYFQNSILGGADRKELGIYFWFGLSHMRGVSLIHRLDTT